MAEGGGGAQADTVSGERASTSEDLRLHEELRHDLHRARDLDEVARAVLAAASSFAHVCRVGIALVEGGGRRLRFTASDRADERRLEWCHIDAYDDVPLTKVVRTGHPILAPLDALDARFADFADHHRRSGTSALAVVPLPGAASPAGGLVVYFDRPQAFDARQRSALERVAHQTAEAVRRLRGPRVADGRQAHDVPPVGGRTAGVPLPDDPRAARAARHFVGETARGWDVPEAVVDVAQLLTSEIVTNAVHHAHTPSHLTVTLDGSLMCVQLRDQGTGGVLAPAGSDDDPLRVHGRGLMLVSALAAEWGAQHDAHGTTAWFTLHLDGEVRRRR